MNLRIVLLRQRYSRITTFTSIHKYVFNILIYFHNIIDYEFIHLSMYHIKSCYACVCFPYYVGPLCHQFV